MIYYPKIYGTCSGANKAIEMAYKLKDEFKNKQIYIYKEILHNDYIINELEKNGIKTANSLDEITKNDILIIRAHGESKEVYNILKEKNINYYDATCINVEKVHKLVNKKYNDGYNIIIIGKKNHPEVIGTNGWCNNKAIIIENENDLNLLNKNTNYYLVSQTTISIDLFNYVVNYLKDNNFKFEYDNTICNHQKIIQQSSQELAKNMDEMYIIGGKNSSNSKELFNECKKVCKNSYFVSNLKEFYEIIKNKNYNKNTKIGLTGGASTQKKQIYEFTHLLEFIIYYKNEYKKIIKKINSFNKSISINDNSITSELINKFTDLNNSGKCLRGCLIDLGYKLSKIDDYALDLACAYETFETSILVHDDIIDNSILRRGKNTINYYYKNKFNDYKDADNTSNSLAICMGDLGFYYSNQIINNKYSKDKNYSKLLSYYNNIVINTIKGEILDVYLPFVEKNDKNHKISENDIFDIYRLKTSVYTIVGPFILGMILGNSKQKDISIMESILEPIGISFQIKDDILGIYSKKEILGKSVYSDIEEFKQTILYSYIKNEHKEYLDELLKYYGKPDINEKDLLKVQKIFEESNAINYATQKMDELFSTSKSNIMALNIKDEIKNILIGFVTYLEIREK